MCESCVVRTLLQRRCARAVCYKRRRGQLCVTAVTAGAEMYSLSRERHGEEQGEKGCYEAGLAWCNGHKSSHKWIAVATGWCQSVQSVLELSECQACASNRDAAFQHSTGGEGIGRSLQRKFTRGSAKYHHTQ